MNRSIDARHTLSAIRVPTLIIHPVGDKVTDVEEGRYMAERIPGAQMVEIDGVDHGWWVQREPIAREVEWFLRGIWDRGEWDLVETERVLATVLFTGGRLLRQLRRPRQGDPVRARDLRQRRRPRPRCPGRSSHRGV